MLKRPLLLGVDAGGTKTVCAITDLAGNTLGEATAGPGNCQSLGYDSAAASVMSAVTGATTAAGVGLDSVVAGCIGMAGAGRPEDQEAMVAALKPLQRMRLQVVDDARIALAGALDAAPGVVIIAGTGSIAYGVGSDGVVARAGGWGWMIGDEGSGYEIGRRALQAALAVRDGVGPPTRLAERICNRWQLERIDEAIPRLHTMREDVQREIAALSQVVTVLAVEGDDVAQGLLDAAGRALGQLAFAVLNRLNFASGEPPQVVLLGGFLGSSKQVRAALAGVLGNSWPAAVLTEPHGTPVHGAIRLARAAAPLPYENGNGSLLGTSATGPWYQRIKMDLMDAIRRGELVLGSRLSSERDLSQQYAVSRMTVRQALVELETEGYLRRIQGRGTFVTLPRVDRPLVALTSFTEEMVRRGLQPGGQVLSQATVPAIGAVAQALAISDGTPVVRLSRLRSADGTPVAIEVAHLRADRVPGLADEDLTGRSLYELLRQQYGLELARASETLEAIRADRYHAQVLQVSEGDPLLRIERLTIDATGAPTEFVQSLYRADRYRFIVQLVR